MLMTPSNTENNTLILRIPYLFGFTKTLAEWQRTIVRWMARSRQRQALADLDDHFLDDIGITRSAATREIAKPFWR